MSRFPPLDFRFTTVTVAGQAPSLHGAIERLRPMLDLGVVGRAGGRRLFDRVQLDTGADDVILPDNLAKDLNLDLRSAPRTTHYTADGRTLTVAYADVELTLAESAARYVRWAATVGFAPVARGLFGFAGGLEFFRLDLDHHAGRFALTPHDHPPAPSPARP